MVKSIPDRIILILTNIEKEGNRMNYFSKLAKIDSMADKATYLFERIVKELGYKTSDIHLLDYEHIHELESKFENMLWYYNVDLSFQSEVSSKYGFKVGGNASGISSDFIIHFTDRKWKEVKMTKSEIHRHLEKHPNAKVYENGRYFSVKQVSPDVVLNARYGSQYSHCGYGSCASEYEYSTKLFKDRSGNLKVDKHCFKWD